LDPIRHGISDGFGDRFPQRDDGASTVFGAWVVMSSANRVPANTNAKQNGNM
jgi:hypothetical protein